jgi:hypothetical protein
MISTTLVVVIVLIIAVWLLFEFRKFKHKIFAVFLIVLILGTYLSFMVAIRGSDIDFTSLEGIGEAGHLYYLWLSSVFGNLKYITANAIQLDWGSINNSTVENESGGK